MSIKIPYGHGYLVSDRTMGSWEELTSRIRELNPELSGAQLVKEAMENPIDSLRLNKLARGKKSAVIIISDHTRPVPSREILPFMISELREGNPAIDVALLVATGCHRMTNTGELRAKLGNEIFDREKIIVHDCCSNDNVAIGVLPSGAALNINRAAMECELLIAEGFIEPHFFAGFSGGRKSVLPGVCAKNTVMGNHCSAFLADPMSSAGVLEGNLVHKDMVAAATAAKLQFIVNVVLNTEHRTVAAFAGNAITAHGKGCNLLMSYCGVKPNKKGDIVITSNGGAPLDQNLYQAVKGIVTAANCAEENGIIIMCAECADGSGSEEFYRAMRDCESVQALFEQLLDVPQAETKMDQWQYQMLVSVLVKHRVIIVSRPELEGMVRDMKMDFAPSLEKAIDIAYKMSSERAHFVIIPDGIGVVPKIEI